MTYNELVSEIARDIGHRALFTRVVVKRVLRSMAKVTEKTLKSDSKVILHDFGVFYTVIPKKSVMFGGTRKPRGKPVIRFKEARRGKAR
jgi:nucleoid DNA-binding protein